METNELKERSQYFISGLPMPEYGAVMLRVANGTYFTNVPVSVIHHSPDGFSWGFSGSGPADLALNILEFAVSYYDLARAHPVKTYSGECSYEAWRFHQEFKRQYVAVVPGHGGVIPWEQVSKWIKASLDGWDTPIPPHSPRTLMVAYSKKMLKEIIMSHAAADISLSRTAFLACLEEDVVFMEHDVKFVAAPYSLEYYDGSFLINDSDDGEKEGELALAVRVKIFELLATPEKWLIRKGWINE